MFMYLTLHLMEFYGVFLFFYTHSLRWRRTLFLFFGLFFAVPSRKGGRVRNGREGRKGEIWDDGREEGRGAWGVGVAATERTLECLRDVIGGGLHCISS